MAFMVADEGKLRIDFIEEKNIRKNCLLYSIFCKITWYDIAYTHWVFSAIGQKINIEILEWAQWPPPPPHWAWDTSK